MREHVTVYEVGPRDGLQNEINLIATSDKISLVNQLSDCGLQKIEVTSFVSPKWVPQMADAAELMASIDRNAGVSYSVLTPNMEGFEAAMEAQASEVAIFASASEGFSQKNINCSIAESLERFAPLARLAEEKGIPLRGYLSCVIECPYDGKIAPLEVAKVAKELLNLGCYEISLGDTIGKGEPENVSVMLDKVTDRIAPSKLAGHFHNTNGRALENIEVAIEIGLRVFDASIGGLGGCPFAPGASGNVSTEAVVGRLESMGFETGIDLKRLAEVAVFARTLRSDA